MRIVLGLAASLLLAGQATGQSQDDGTESAAQAANAAMAAAEAAAAAGDAPTSPNDWVIITGTSTGTLWRIQRRDIRPGAAYRRVWVKEDHSRDKTKRARETKVLWSVRCSERTISVISAVQYAADGSILGSDSVSYTPQHVPAVPESVGSDLVDWVCP